MAINKTINKRTNSHGAMRNCIEYVLREGKTDQHLVHIIGPYPYGEVKYDLVYQSFLEEKRLWNKDSGRMYAHNVISWHKDEKITPEQALEFGIEFAEKWFTGFQTVVSVHRDKDHIHCHMVTNSVSYENGKKLHNSRKDLERMKQLTNRMCQERGLTVAEKGKHFDGSQIENGEVIAWSKDKYNLFRNEAKDSYVADCAMAVLSIMESCISREQFIKEMGNLGWNVNWTENRKHITFQNSEGKKVRDSNLSKTFHLKISKGELEDEFIRNEQKERYITGRDDTADADLARYYRQVEEAVAGTSGGIVESKYRKGQTSGNTKKGSGKYPEMSGTDAGASRKSPEDLIRKSEAARRASEANRGKSETANLSRTQNINLSLQRSNDNLRNRNGLLSRKEQEQLEEKIRDVQDRNSKLEKMVVQSSLETVEEALKKQQEAEKRMCSLELLLKMERRDAARQLDKTKRQMKKKIMETEKKKNLWCLGLFFLSLLSVMRNEVMLNDLSEVVMFPVWFWKEITKFADWLFYPQNENFSFNGNNIEFSSGAAWIVRFLCVAIAIMAVLLVVWIICGFCREYKKHWNEYEMYLVVVVFAVMAVIGDVFSRYIHINLLLMTVGVISLQFIIRKRNVLVNVK